MFKIWGSHSDDDDEYSDVMSRTVEEISTLRDVTRPWAQQFLFSLL